MPAPSVRDEDIWEKAKGHIGPRGETDYDEGTYWAVVMDHYKDLGGRLKKKKDSSMAEELDRVAMSLTLGGLPEAAHRVCQIRDYFIQADEVGDPEDIPEGAIDRNISYDEWDRIRFTPSQEVEVQPEDPKKREERKKRIHDKLLTSYYADLYDANPDDPYIPLWIKDWFARKEKQDAEDAARLSETGKDSSHSILSNLTKAARRAFQVGNWKATAKLMAARDILVADLDPSGGDIPNPEDTETTELFSYDTYQGSDPMKGPGIAVKMEEGQVRIYIIEDPISEVYGEVYLSGVDKGWMIDHMEEASQTPLLPQEWRQGQILRDEEVTDWLGRERVRFLEGQESGRAKDVAE